MENNPVSPWKANLSSGIFLGLLLVAFSLIVYFADLMFVKWVNAISYLIYIAGLFYGIRAYRHNYLGGSLTYGQGVGAAVIISLYAGVITGLYSFVLYTYIDPDLPARILDQSRQLLLEKGMPEAQVESSLRISKIFVQGWVTGLMSIVGSLMIGTVIGLILSIFLKNESGDPFAGVEDEKTGTE